MPGYFKNSSHRFYGAIFALVLLFFYEVLIIWEPSSSGFLVRNAPEAWMRNTLFFLGVPPKYFTHIFLTLSLVAIPLFYRSGVTFHKRFLLFMVLEAIFFGILTGFIIQVVMRSIFLGASPLTGNLAQNIGLALGAGLFEELLFRVIITSSLIWIGCKLIKVRLVAILVAILISSILFSLAHHIGSAGEPFEMYAFMYRFFAGLWFTVLYTVRGFGITSLTHAFYDIFVILNLI